MEQSNKKTIAKNTVFLYIRMLLSTIVSLYTSRVVLQTLGVEDYGIYGVVGGVVTMLSFLNASMSGATSRFLTVAIGKGDTKKLKDTFSSALNIHIAIAIIMFIFAETVGLWFLCNKLVIPAERMVAAHVVYQFSIIGTLLSITQVPYNAVIIAHEKMDIYAYIELLNVFLKLGIVYLLVICNWDKLILYAGLTLCVSILILCIYRLYCIKQYEETKYHFIWDKELVKPMLSFSGWDLYGNMSVVFFTQGITMLLNMFFGPALNAANNVSMTVQGTIKAFAFNVIQAFRPQIIKQYSQGCLEAVNQYCTMATQYTLILFAMIAIPFIIETRFILDLWLGLIPEHTIFFLRIILIGTIFNLANNIVNIPLHACGRMKFFSIATGTCFWVSIPLMFLLLKLGTSADLSYLVVIFAYLSCLTVALCVLKRNVPEFRIRVLLFQGYFKCVLCCIPGIAISWGVSNILEEGFIRIISITLLNALSLLVCTLYIIMNKSERSKCFTTVRSKLSKKYFLWED